MAWRGTINGGLDPTFNASSINLALSITDFDNRALGDGTNERSVDVALREDGN